MKKLLIVTLSLVLVLAFAMSAFAGIRNTIHDFQSNGAASGFGGGAQRGMCSYCHIPHVSQGDRLWPTPGTGQTAVAGLIGNLCGSCHYTATANDNTPASNGALADGVLRSGDVYNTGKVNHVLIDDGVYGNNTRQNYVGAAVAAQFNQANVWPYCGTQGVASAAVTDNVQIECSSCHNPHSEAYGASTVTIETNSQLRYGNDYLRSAMYAGTVSFCEYCHEEKTRNTNLLNTIGTGTHPVGTTATAGAASQADIHIESAERLALTASNIVSTTMYDMGIGTYVGANSVACYKGIGTHLTGYDTGGVTCQTCHLVHGAPRGNTAASAWDATNSQGSYDNANQIMLGSSDDGFVNILAIENDANGGVAGYSYPTEGRTAGDYNDLCVDCHETTPSVGRNWAGLDGSASRTTADIGNDAHPVNITPDGLSESGFDLTVIDPSWTNAARWAGNAATRGNHDLTGSGRWDGNSVPGISRSEVVCLTCHAIHDGINGSPILRSASTTYCRDCHSRSIGDVSHPVGPGSAMRDNPDGVNWPNGDTLPLANYYTGTYPASFDKGTSTTTDMACFTCHAAHDGVDSFMLRVTDDNSRICVGCHTGFVADVTNRSENPSDLIAEYEEAAGTRLGSHYTGTVSSSTGYVGEARWAYTGDWTDTATGGATAQTSHWAGNATFSRMQCQSCHTPHNAASGLVEANTYDGLTAPIDFLHGADAEDINTNFDGTDATLMAYTPTTALLLGNNARSKICATCHWPEGTHVTTIYTVGAKPDPERDGAAGRLKKEYRDYCSRTSAFIIATLNGGQEVQYDVFDLIANDTDQDTISTPESPTNFPPLFPGVVPTTATGEMLCDSCHAPHGAATGAGAFILEAGTGGATTKALANQRIASRNYQDLCWKCHDK